MHQRSHILAPYLILCALWPITSPSQETPVCPYDKLAALETTRTLLQEAASHATEPIAAKIRSLEIKEGSPEQIEESKERIGEAVKRLESFRTSDFNGEALRTGLTNAKEKILDSILRYDHPDFEKRLRASIHSYDAFFYLNSPYFSQTPKSRSFYADLFNDPDLEPAARIVGEVFRTADSDFERNSLATALVEVRDLLKDKPSLVANEMLTRLGERFLFEVDHAGMTDGSRNKIDFTGKPLAAFVRQHAPGERSHFVDRLRTEWSDLEETQLRSATEPYIIDSLLLHDHPDVRTLLRRFVTSGHFDALHEKDRGALFYHLSQAQLKAALSSNPQFKRLWHNTLEALLTGEVKVSVENLGPLVRGDWGDSMIRLNRGFVVHADEISAGPSVKASVLNTIAHEVNHAKDGFLMRSSTVYYFEKEMNAWTVGFFAEHERLPDKREAALHAVYMLTTDNYPTIAAAWKTDPNSFSRHLADLGLKGATTDFVLAFKVLTVETHMPAPQWGWEGYLENRPTPPETIQIASHFKTLARHAQGRLAKTLNAAVPPFASGTQAVAALNHLRFQVVIGLLDQTAEDAKRNSPYGRALRALRTKVLSEAPMYYSGSESKTFAYALAHFKAIQFFQAPRFPRSRSRTRSFYLTRLSSDAFSQSRFALGTLATLRLTPPQEQKLINALEALAPHLDGLPDSDANKAISNFASVFLKYVENGDETPVEAFIEKLRSNH
jgi:hypothetical protein